MRDNSLKTSMFNHYTVCEDQSLILYNSYHGINSIRKVSSKKSEKVIAWLNGENFNYEDVDFNELESIGYFVSSQTDEKAIRRLLYLVNTTDNTLNLIIHTTEACNFRCQYCALDFNTKNMSLEIQNAIVKYIACNIHKYKGVHISWFGGEPLLAPDVIENISKQVIKICRNMKKIYSASITTNGYLLTPKMLDLLIDCKVFSYTVTIDGLANTHDHLRVLKNGGPTFNTIISNMRYIRDKVSLKMINFIIRINITTEIFEKLEECYLFFDSEFGTDARFSLFVRPTSDWGGERIKKMYSQLLEKSSMALVYRFLTKIVKPGHIQFTSNYFDIDVGGCTCDANWLNKFSIGVAGEVSKCDNAEFSVGKIDEHGKLLLDDKTCSQWVTSWMQIGEECDQCFYSCACFAGSCPKTKVLYNSTACTLCIEEIDELLKLIVSTNNIKMI